MGRIVIIFSILLISVACTKQTVYDTGICSPYHDCSIMDYLRGNDYEWGYTVELIEQAGLVDLFEGKVDSLPEITFLGIPGMSVERYLYDHGYDSVQQISSKLCRMMVLQHVAKGKILQQDIAFRNLEYTGNSPLQDGCTDITMLNGNTVRFWLDKSDYAGVPDAGPVAMSAWSLQTNLQIPLASPNIQPLNGVVHSLNYNYKLDFRL
ncbi:MULTISPECIES: hypothetical protein [Butyricimonas]|uniref:hypothetical protein n=1 Tax=Butyricimonas TaxID=574697 RepID=UPI001D06558A|nr:MULTISPECIES: hypothetical protein [Butyricimonas]MCB6971766.1 hypothetical protein [Butyricimonas synergistica]MCG4518626.1 hypothetical protein [Butyricimonas sp. DFI.6.44]